MLRSPLPHRWVRCRSQRMLLALPLLFPLLLLACQREAGSGPTINELNAVVVLAPHDVWAVGGMTTSRHFGLQVLIEHWDGAAWHTAMPDIAGELCAISALSASDIWAVGDTWNCGAGGQLLTLHWDGERWQQVAALLPDQSQEAREVFNGVVALAPNNVWAVGSYRGPPPASAPPNQFPRHPTTGGLVDMTLIEHWDGHSWTLDPQSFQGWGGTLQAIVAHSANDIWAVGFGMHVYGDRLSLAEHWDGHGWTVVPMPGYAQHLLGDPQLFGLTVLPSGDLWAVGETNESALSGSPLIERWDGTAWQVVYGQAPAQPNRSGTLQAVAAVTAQDVWTVGEVSAPTGNTNGLLVLHWDGHAWQLVNTPLPLLGIQLNAIGVSSASDIWTVGSTASSRSAVFLTLIEHWNGSVWQPVPSPNPGTTPPLMGAA